MKLKLLCAALLCASSQAYASCGSSFCTMNTHWDTQGLVNDEGLRIDLRYSYAKANTPRVGASKVVNDPTLSPGGEVENMRTINQSLNLDFDYAFNRQWSVAVGLPLVMRDHAHTVADGLGGYTAEQNKFTELGDIRVVGNYKLDSGDHLSGSGVRFGVKLPTGKANWEFVPGAGPAEGGLQPGTGSTDAILGAYYHQDVANSPWGWFVSGQLQTAINTRDGYRPGNEVSLDLGAHYTLAPALTGLLQLNANFKERDSGNGAKVNPHSGAHSLSLSPGLSFAVAPTTRLYGFVQLPIYQYANSDPTWLPGDPVYGQLTAPWSLSLGISQTF
ncbi:MAG: hypothetical protein COZ20_04400 [Gallionellales bacterium CG_4_10_14_3_um_filter_54_96]|nr:MAG: hypothetical protein COW45_02980 [Gallionellales bacterium CG17_big_fil_post_rev_8_21_14_2_50_54_146]PIX04096.1 MAG: hypothetical protein COZ77_08280 [Gallionellales bacterium CG_4_8_14_3_um_filter_54_18]PIY04975.1 MAG: hypothetical protein COZ20_04400 [Gallionellales bacterium CG_4_10_14_3_um_filter_54_96]PJC05734.1 MAG: hypothetical protein CO070_01045 [Gallionellales bacterium CG_4_9_14_0_8_um_filter_55_61]HCJ50437.1 hypothetical protein [Gallionella sp.]